MGGRHIPSALVGRDGGALLALLLTSVLSAAIAIGRRPPARPTPSPSWPACSRCARRRRRGRRGGPRSALAQRFVDGIFVSAGIVSLVGLLQHVQLLPFAIPVISVPGSTFGNHNMAAEAVALSIPFGLAAVRLPDDPASPWASSSPSCCSSPSPAPGGLIGAVLGGATFLFVRRPVLPRAPRIVALPVGLAIVLAALLPGASRRATPVTSSATSPVRTSSTTPSIRRRG